MRLFSIIRFSNRLLTFTKFVEFVKNGAYKADLTVLFNFPALRYA